MTHFPPTVTAKDNISQQLRYIPQLDGLRALAVIPVCIQHWGGEQLNPLGVPIGTYGVGLFFVLSGFLITRILISQRQQNGKASDKLKLFWYRRSLRIFPLYYIFLTLGCLLNIEGFHSLLYWHITYTTNIAMSLYGPDIAGYAGHLWTLSIEEQFYLIWPFLILCLHKKYLIPLCLSVIAFSVTFRFTFGMILSDNPSIATIWPFTLYNIDFLAIGALWFLFMTLKTNAAIFGTVSLVFAIIGFSLTNLFHDFLWPLRQTFLAIVFASLIAEVTSNKYNTLSTLLSCPLMTFLGKRSYGIYIIHSLAYPLWIYLYWSAPLPIYRISERLSLNPGDLNQLPIRIVFCTTFTIILSIISFKYIETPFLRLKDRT